MWSRLPSSRWERWLRMTTDHVIKAVLVVILFGPTLVYLYRHRRDA